MKGIWICLCLILVQIHAQEAEVGFPSEFTTKNGNTYVECKVKRVEEGALVVEHKDGIAKISMFEVSADLQKKYNFDPVAAMEKYHRDKEAQRKLKWKLFWEGQKHKAAVEAEKDREKFLEIVKTTWLPVEARVVKPGKDGAFVSASQIKFVATKTKSTLGFEIDGPKRKTLVRMSPNVIFITATGISGTYWKGYLEPFAHGTVPDPSGNGDEVPSYRAVARTEIK